MLLGFRPAGLLLLGALAGAVEQALPWSGVISVDESINGPVAQGGDQHELEHFALQVQDHLRQARAELTTAPPFIARIIREDMGFYQAELERIAAERGGPLQIGHITYFIKGSHMLVVSDGARLQIDRIAGEAQGIVDGQILKTRLQLAPDLENIDAAPAGETLLSYETKRVSRKIRGRTYVIDVAPGLPNPYRFGLLESDQDVDLMRALAELPGLPMLVSEATGDATRSLCVTGVDRRDVNDRIFAP